MDEHCRAVLNKLVPVVFLLELNSELEEAETCTGPEKTSIVLKVL